MKLRAGLVSASAVHTRSIQWQQTHPMHGFGSFVRIGNTMPITGILMMTVLSTAPPAEWTIAFRERTERHEVARAAWSTYSIDGQAALTLRIEAGRLLAPLPPPEGMTTPFWELTVILPPGETFDLKPGTVHDIPTGFDVERDEHMVDFYYYEHEVSDSNRLHITAVADRTIDAELTGTAWEFQTDGSSQPVTLKARATFLWDAHATRSSR